MELNKIYNVDALEGLKTLPDRSVNCCVTSPPYYGLRDYGVAGQMGLEDMPEEYVSKMVEVFEEVRRVIKDDGTLWINIGDSYARNPVKGVKFEGKQTKFKNQQFNEGNRGPKIPPGTKEKDLIGVPWMLAFALRSAGWYLRSDIIWAKPNCMPESVTDRPTRSHEYIFLLAKGQSKSRIIKFSDLSSEIVHFGLDLGFNSSRLWSNEICIQLATTIFNFSQIEKNYSLPPFYSEIWQQRPCGGDSDFISSLPKEYIPTVWSARLLASNCTTKDFLHQINCFFIALPNCHYLLKSWCSSKIFNSPFVYSDTKTTIAIHNAGKVCEIDFFHGTIIQQSPSGCNYYYDYEAIKEPALYDVDGTGTATRRARQKEDNKSIPEGIQNGIRAAGFKDAAKMNGKHLEKQRGHSRRHNGFNDRWDKMTTEEQCTGMRNKRDVWMISPAQFPEAHFATFPEDLIVPCIKAGCPEMGVVLDPFMGAATTALVARKLNRNYVGFELNPDYITIAENRLKKELGMFL